MNAALHLAIGMGVGAGLVELAWVLARHPDAAAAPLSTATAVLGGSVAVAVLAATPGLLGLQRLGPLVRGLRTLGTPGTAQVRLLARLAQGAAALALVFAAGFWIALATQRAFWALDHRRTSVALLVAGLVTAAVALSGLLTWAVQGRLDRACQARWPDGVAPGALVRALVGVSALVAVATWIALARGQATSVLVLELYARGLLLGLGGLWGALVVRATPARRGAWLAALLLVPLGGIALQQSPSSRAAVGVQGLISRAPLQALQALADRDGDGSPGPWLQGADCDDRSPGVHPRAQDVPGDGLDQDCTGTDRSAPAAIPSTAAGPPTGLDVLLVSIDTLRADRLHATRDGAPLMPALAGLAARGTEFTRAITPSPSTLSATWAILSGRPVSALVTDGARLAPGGQTLLAEPFAAAGYDTAAMLAFAKGFTRAEGAVAGFGAVDFGAVPQQQQRHYSAHAIVDGARDWLLARPTDAPPALLWLHLVDPHFPYAAIPGAPDFGDRLQDRYDSNVAHTDAALARLLETLEDSGRADQTLVAVFGDHGEEFQEHGQHFHGKTVYDEVVHVPLVIAAPGLPPSRVDAPTSLVDLFPTLLDLAGLTTPPSVLGQSQVPALSGRSAGARPVLTELVPDRHIQQDLIAVWAHGHKLTWDLRANHHRLTSLGPPADGRDLWGQDPALDQRMREALDRTRGAR